MTEPERPRASGQRCKSFQMLLLSLPPVQTYLPVSALGLPLIVSVFAPVYYFFFSIWALICNSVNGVIFHIHYPIFN